MERSGEAEKAAVKGAMVRKGRGIITNNLDAEFSNAIAKNSDPYNVLKGTISPHGGIVNKISPSGGFSRTASAFTVDRVFDVPHNPFRNRAAIETPQNIVELYARFRYYYQREPLVGTAIELHTEFPLSAFELRHEDPTLREEFNDMAQDLNLFEFLLDMVHEYYLIGECIAFGIFDDPVNPSVWKSFILLNPLNVDIASSPLTDGRSNTLIKLKLDDATRKIVEGGPSNPKTGELYNRLPADVIQAVRHGQGLMDLNPVQVSHFKRKGNYFKVRGESMLMRIMHLLAYRDKLRDALYSTADRHITPREVWKVGEPGNPASEEELQALADMVSATYLDPSQAIVWHHALQVDVIGTADKMMPVTQEMDKIEEEMLVGLMLNKGFLDSSYGAYANMSVALDVLINRYLILRQRIERWMRESVWAPICRIHDIYKPTQAELDHRIRVKNKPKRPWVPEVVWSKQELRDSTQKLNLLLQVRDKLGKPGYPRDRIYQILGDNPKDINKLIKKEQEDMMLEEQTKISLKGGNFGGPGLNLPNLGGPGGPPGIELGGGGGPLGAPPEGKGENLPATNPPETVIGPDVKPPTGGPANQNEPTS